jgi:hypothetical protein
MENKTKNYEDFVLDPAKDVIVPMSTYIALTNVIQEVEKKHSTVIRSDKHAFFHKVTNERLSDKSKAKMKPEKLASDYFENIDLKATAKNIRVDRDELGGAALQLMAEFRGIFKINVDAGNGMLRPTPGSELQNAAEVAAPAPDALLETIKNDADVVPTDNVDPAPMTVVADEN